jgi:mono/diheme cytochrome c family protein
MIKTSRVTLLLTLMSASLAYADQYSALYAGGDPVAGKVLLQKNCISCHASSFGGDGSAIYTRENRLVKTSRGLKAQVRNCNTMLGLKWFEDEELHVASYLNQTYSHFEK